MPKWAHQDVLDGGLNAIKTSATKQLLLKAYAAGDSYATVLANALSEAAMASGDFTLSSNGSNRVLTTAAGKSANATADSGVGPDLHIAFTDGAAKVLYVTDETSNRVVITGDPCNFPVLTYTANQPV